MFWPGMRRTLFLSFVFPLLVSFNHHLLDVFEGNPGRGNHGAGLCEWGDEIKTTAGLSSQL